MQGCIQKSGAWLAQRPTELNIPPRSSTTVTHNIYSNTFHISLFCFFVLPLSHKSGLNIIHFCYYSFIYFLCGLFSLSKSIHQLVLGQNPTYTHHSLWNVSKTGSKSYNPGQLCSVSKPLHIFYVFFFFHLILIKEGVLS